MINDFKIYEFLINFNYIFIFYHNFRSKPNISKMKHCGKCVFSCSVYHIKSIKENKI